MKKFIYPILLFSITARAEIAGSLVTPHFNEVLQMTRDLKGPGTLYVVDIDNTLLKNTSDLGSEHWFLWQKKLLEGGVRNLPLVADSQESLFEIQNIIYQAGRMTPVSSEFIDHLNFSAAQGAQVIALTSRLAEMRSATLKEMQSNLVPLSSRKKLGLQDFTEAELPYDLNHPENSGLSRQEVEEMQLSSPRPVTFDSGVFFTQGQHKGAMLRSLLHRSLARFQNIVFIDDRVHHVEGMKIAFKNRPEKLYAVQYTRSREWIDTFNAGDKQEAQNSWCKLVAGLVTSNIGFNGDKFRKCLSQ
jgi:hypothetical protein